MRIILVLSALFIMILPLNAFCQYKQETMSQSDAEKYRNFLNVQRGGEQTGTVNYQDYSDDRNTKVRKLSESVQHHENEAKIAKEQARDERNKEKEDLKLSKEKKIQELVDKGSKAKSDKDSEKYYKGARELKDSPYKSKKSIGVSVR